MRLVCIALNFEHMACRHRGAAHAACTPAEHAILQEAGNVQRAKMLLVCTEPFKSLVSQDPETGDSLPPMSGSQCLGSLRQKSMELVPPCQATQLAFQFVAWWGTWHQGPCPDSVLPAL